MTKENESTVAGSQHGKGQTKTNENPGQTPDHQPASKEKPLYIRNSHPSVLRFNNGMR